MSLTAVAFLLIFGAGALVTLVKGPWTGWLVYLYVYYSFPPHHWWGDDLPDVRWARVMILLVFASYLLHGPGGRRAGDPASSPPGESSGGGGGLLGASPTKWFVLLLLVMAGVSYSSLAVVPSESQAMLKEFVIFFGKFYLLFKVVNTPERWLLFVWANVAGCSYWAFDGWRDPSMSNGRLESVGGPDTAEANAVAAHVVAFIPVVLVYALQVRSWRRLVPFGILAFILNLIILTNSRGGLLGLAIAGAGIFLAMPARKRWAMVLGSIAVAGLFLYLTDDRFWERQQTIVEHEDDGSASGRLATWKGALDLIADHPLGVGGKGSDELSPIYWAEVVEEHEGQKRTMHNSYLMMTADFGILGGLLYLLLLLSVLRSFGRCVRRLRMTGRPDLEAFASVVYAVRVGAVGFFFCSFFINRQWAELNYWLAGLAAALEVSVLPALMREDRPPVCAEEDAFYPWKIGARARRPEAEVELTPS